MTKNLDDWLQKEVGGSNTGSTEQKKSNHRKPHAGKPHGKRPAHKKSHGLLEIRKSLMFHSYEDSLGKPIRMLSPKVTEDIAHEIPIKDKVLHTLLIKGEGESL